MRLQIAFAFHEVIFEHNRNEKPIEKHGPDDIIYHHSPVGLSRGADRFVDGVRSRPIVIHACI